MTAQQLTQLRKMCGDHLIANEVAPGTTKGDAAIRSFWIGALRSTELYSGESPAFPAICLMTGRYAELVDMGGTGA